MRRREFMTLLGGAAAGWPLAARAQQPGLPVVAVVGGGTFHHADSAPFQKGLSEMGYIAGQNVAVESHSLNGQYERAPSLMADLVRSRVTVIATPGSQREMVTHCRVPW